MSDRSPANFELSIALPLGVIANQLMKVEAELRFLNAKTSTPANERPGDAQAGQVAAQLERINEALEAIRRLVQDIGADLQPRAANPRSFKARSERDD
jgi:hypothetical protein